MNTKEHGMDAMTTLAALAHRAVVDHPVIEEAADALWAAIQLDADLRESLSEQLMQTAVREYVYRARSAYKIGVKDAALERLSPVGVMEEGHGNGGMVMNPPRCNMAAMQMRSDLAGQSILKTWRMPDGREIGEFRGDELIPYAETECTLGAGHKANAAFYASLALRAGKSLVRRKVKPHEADELWMAARKAQGLGD